MIVASEVLPDGTLARLPPDDGHGSMRGHRAHLKAGELPCPRCSDANSAYMKDWRAGRPPSEAQRAAARARGRALGRLAREHPARFTELLAEETRRARREAATSGRAHEDNDLKG